MHAYVQLKNAYNFYKKQNPIKLIINILFRIFRDKHDYIKTSKLYYFFYVLFLYAKHIQYGEKKEIEDIIALQKFEEHITRSNVIVGLLDQLPTVILPDNELILFDNPANIIGVLQTLEPYERLNFCLHLTGNQIKQITSYVNDQLRSPTIKTQETLPPLESYPDGIQITHNNMLKQSTSIQLTCSHDDLVHDILSQIKTHHNHPKFKRRKNPFEKIPWYI